MDGDAKTPPRWRGKAWLLLLALAIVEVVGHLVVRARVVDDADWAAAAERVRREHRAGDLVVVAPSGPTPSSAGTSATSSRWRTPDGATSRPSSASGC